MHRLKAVINLEDIFVEYKDTPIGELLSYHNLGEEFQKCDTAKMLIGMCMDNRKSLRLPDNFAFIIRAGGANLQQSEFKVSFAIAVGGVQYLAVIGHTQCGMVNLESRKEQFIEGLVERGGCTRELANEHFEKFSPRFGITNEVDFVLGEVMRLRETYPKIVVAPLIYKVEDNKLYQIVE